MFFSLEKRAKYDLFIITMCAKNLLIFESANSFINDQYERRVPGAVLSIFPHTFFSSNHINAH